MKVISANLNGIRAAAKKGFFTWMINENADVICIQETKAQLEQLTDSLYSPPGYQRFFFDAEKKGYSGTAVYSKTEPDKVITGLGWDTIDKEGRYLQVDYGNLSIASLYLPSGSSKDDRQALKMDCLDKITPLLKQMVAAPRDYIICGDWNIVHKRIDIKNFNGNKNRSGCLPEERAWMDKLFGDEIGMVDAFRVLNQEPEQYTWWSNRGQAWANNTGWRIDYQVITPGLTNRLKSTYIYKDQRFSDHAPLVIEYEGNL